MSNLGKPLRQLFYELKGYSGEEITGKALFKFAYGSLLEALVISLAEAAGYKAERFQEEVIVDGVVGHIDLVLNGILVDVKSCSPFSFLKFQNGTLFEDDVFGYQAQLCGYAHALNLPAAWVAVNKVDGDVCVLELPKEKIDSYDVVKRISEVRTVLAADTPPERCYLDEEDGASGNRKLGVGCSYCTHKFECWKDSNNGRGLRVFLYSGKPRFLTTVKKEPRVFEARKEI